MGKYVCLVAKQSRCSVTYAYTTVRISVLGASDYTTVYNSVHQGFSQFPTLSYHNLRKHALVWNMYSLPIIVSDANKDMCLAPIYILNVP